MTVQELIERLSEFNPEMEIVIKDGDLSKEIICVDGFLATDRYTPQGGSWPVVAIGVGPVLGDIHDLEDI